MAQEGFGSWVYVTKGAVMPPTLQEGEDYAEFEKRVRGHLELLISSISNTYEAIGFIASHMYVTDVNANMDFTQITPYVTADLYYLGHHMCVALEHRIIHPDGYGFIGVFPAHVRNEDVC